MPESNTAPIGLDPGYAWPHAARLLPDGDVVATLFGRPPVADRPEPERPTPAPPEPAFAPAVAADLAPAAGDAPEAAAAPQDPHEPDVPDAPDVLESTDGRTAEPAPGPRRGRVAIGRRVVQHGLRAVAWTVVAAVVWTLAWSTVPRLFGWRPTLVVGGSMAPRINRGDVIVVRPVGATGIGPGAVITFTDRSRAGALVTHRVVAVLPDGTFQTRGDHNHDADVQPVPLRDVRGRAVLRLPYVGRPLIWVRDGAWAPLAALAAAVVTVAALVRPRPRSATPRPTQMPLGTVNP